PDPPIARDLVAVERGAFRGGAKAARARTARPRSAAPLMEKRSAKSRSRNPHEMGTCKRRKNMAQGVHFATKERPYSMRIAIYARVSTKKQKDQNQSPNQGKKDQDPENQLRQLREWCDKAGHTIAHEYVDRESGRNGTKSRKQFAQLLEDAHKRE